MKRSKIASSSIPQSLWICRFRTTPEKANAWIESIAPFWQTQAVVTQPARSRMARIDIYSCSKNEACRCARMYGGKVIRFLRSDWWKAERKNTKPLRLNETLWIVPHPDQARYWKSRYPKKTILCIGNRMAFGTGRHETTAMCLHAMLWLMNQFQHALSKTTCIDVGTGSGILVLAARALGFEEGIGIDHDATAIRIARQHAQENKIKARFILAEATRSPVRKKADLIFANLYSEVLVRAADQLIQMAKPGGFLILSGITKNQEPEIISAYAQLRWIRKFHQRNWACLVARRLQGSY